MEEPHQHGLITDFPEYSGCQVPGMQVQELCPCKQKNRCIEYIRCQSHRVVAATESNVSGNQIGNVIPSPEGNPKEDNRQKHLLYNAGFFCCPPKPIEPFLKQAVLGKQPSDCYAGIPLTKIPGNGVGNVPEFPRLPGTQKHRRNYQQKQGVQYRTAGFPACQQRK